MQFKRHLIALSLTAALTQLTACGGGSSDSAPAPQPEPQPGQSLEGATADGYLVNAQVCLDLNRNGECDNDEPSTLTQAGGQYSFDNLDAALDLSQVQMLVKVIAGQTEDEDNPGVVLTQGYTMTAPAGVVEFVSPLTTLLASEMDRAGVDQETAAAALEQTLGILGSDLSLVEDYIVGKQQQANGDGYKRLHKVAQVVARVTAKAQRAVEQNGGTGGDAEDSEVADAIAETLTENLERLVNRVDEAEANGQEPDADTIADEVAEELPLDPEDVQEQVEEKREHANKQRSQLLEILANQGGMFELDGHVDTFYNAAEQQCVVEKELGYQQIQMIEQVISFNQYAYQGPEAGFVAQSDEEDRDALVWKESGWAEMSDQVEVVSVEEDGSVIVRSDMDGQQRVWARSLDLDGLKLKRYANSEQAWMKQYRPEQVFPEGAMGYQLAFKQLEERAILPYDAQCNPEVQWCNQVSLPTGPVQTLAELMNQENDSAEPKLVHISGDHKVSLAVALYGDAEQAQGDIKLYLVEHDHCDDAGCNQPQLKEEAEASWERTPMGLVLNLPDWVHSFTDMRHGRPLLTEFQGRVRHGFILGAGLTRNDQWTFNQVAMNSFLEQLGTPELRRVVNPSECGFDEPDQPDQPGDGTQPGDGDNDDRTPPELVADDQAMAALAGSHYLADDDDFNALIHFAPQGRVLVWLEERDNGEKQTEVLGGNWLVDANHQLLMQFGDKDWVLIQLPSEGLGSDTMKVTEEDEGEVREYPMDLVRPFTFDGLSTPLDLRLTNQDSGNCTLELHFNALPTDQEGSGWVDLSKCQDEEGESPQAQEFLWAQTDAGLTLTPINPNGEFARESHTLYWYGSQAQQQVLIRSLDLNADGTMELESLDRFSFELIR